MNKHLSHPLILASTSPRRRELLSSLDMAFQIVSPNVDEEAFQLDHLSPAEIVQFLSRTKAQEVFKLNNQAIVIGADTIVVCDGQVFGKPKDAEDAFRMLKQLQGNSHSVYSGITVFHPTESPNTPPFISRALQTSVTMKPLSDAELKAYIATGEPMDKAGAYAIQGYGSTLIERIDGCYFNVVGMSLYLLSEILHELDEPLLGPTVESVH